MTIPTFREWRLALGFTQQGVADALGVTKRYIQQIEAGDNQPDARMGVTAALATALKFQKFAPLKWAEQPKVSRPRGAPSKSENKST
jgi:transcriptional regulator with XRE-family HTH domain